MRLVNHALAQVEVSVWQIGEGLQQDLGGDCGLKEGWVELVQFQDSQVGFQIIGIFLGLHLHIALQGGQVLRILPVDTLEQLAHVGSHLLKHRHDYCNLPQPGLEANTSLAWRPRGRKKEEAC
ncbi:hypothetical protein P7K49_039780 [Saguinus oedipus]|uniref:Uncharacterized protein n=1 Tax=Saguinus oedipus TaxID=9490 RepID=A0ABQ9TC44_SAGOE|nr:hypothetical protein P7K49_039780 [Saguinus oedipus]